nr:MAG TPA: hypothetical protein [Caudoviricetes sp.]
MACFTTVNLPSRTRILDPLRRVFHFLRNRNDQIFSEPQPNFFCDREHSACWSRRRQADVHLPP